MYHIWASERAEAKLKEVLSLLDPIDRQTVERLFAARDLVEICKQEQEIRDRIYYARKDADYAVSLRILRLAMTLANLAIWLRQSPEAMYLRYVRENLLDRDLYRYSIMARLWAEIAKIPVEDLPANLPDHVADAAAGFPPSVFIANLGVL